MILKMPELLSKGIFTKFGHRQPVRRDEVQKPQEGERFSSENLKAFRDRHSERPVRARCLHRIRPSLWEEDLASSGAVAGGEFPWRGHEAQGRLESDRSFGRLRTTDFRGGQRPEGRRGSARLGSAGPFEPTPSGLGRPRGSTRAAEGETFEGRIPRALPSETWREVSGGTKRHEGTNPEDAA
jgi:hypothetical protein